MFFKSRKRIFGNDIFTKMIELKNIRAHFPIFDHHPQLVYLDNAATTHKPQSVIDAICSVTPSGNLFPVVPNTARAKLLWLDHNESTFHELVPNKLKKLEEVLSSHQSPSSRVSPSVRNGRSRVFLTKCHKPQINS